MFSTFAALSGADPVVVTPAVPRGGIGKGGAGGGAEFVEGTRFANASVDRELIRRFDSTPP